MAEDIKFSLIIASKNEKKDIRLAIESSLNQTYHNKEIICVDDSSDGTKEIIQSYASQGVTLINGRAEGCCQARNLGITSATGDVIVFLTADTRLLPGYLEAIKRYYDLGFDIVMVTAKIFNLNNIYSEFLEMQHIYQEKNENSDPLTTQGYSVRRNLALEVGGISGGVYAFNTCRDWTLVKKMEALGHKKIFARELVVEHKAPDNLAEYWEVRKTRGLMSAYQPYFLEKYSKPYIFIKLILKSVRYIFTASTFFPVMVKIYRISRQSNWPIANSIRFIYPYSLQALSFWVGEWKGFLNILKLNRK